MFCPCGLRPSVVRIATMPAPWSPGEASAGTVIVTGTTVMPAALVAVRPGTTTLPSRSPMVIQAPRSARRADVGCSA
jgi:hypothetical protein